MGLLFFSLLKKFDADERRQILLAKKYDDNNILFIIFNRRAGK